jgi:hypothetical protein
MLAAQKSNADAEKMKTNALEQSASRYFDFIDPAASLPDASGSMANLYENMMGSGFTPSD